MAGTTIAIGALVSLYLLWQTKKGIAALAHLVKTSKTAGEDLLTWVAAAIATAVSAQGMWRFAGDILGFDGPLRVGLFAFIEVAMFTSAVRAKRNMRENFSAGIDGAAVWVLTCLSAVLSCMDARSPAEAVFRLSAPLVAAWLWERGMAIERHRITGRSRINWTITPEKLLIRLGLAEGRERSASEVATQLLLTNVAITAKKAQALRESGASPRKLRKALTRLDAAFEKATAQVGLAGDRTLQERVRDEVAALRSSSSLLDVAPASAWTSPAEPSDFARLANETKELNDALTARDELKTARDEIQAARDEAREIEANLLTLVSHVTGRPPVSVTSDVTSTVTHIGVTPGVTKEVTNPPFFAPWEWLDARADVTPGVTSDVTPGQVTDEITEKVTFDVTNPDIFDLRWPPLDLSDVTAAVTPGVTGDEVTDEVTPEVTATQRMREHWDAAIAADRWPAPSVTELAEIGGVHHSHASRLRKEWVAKLPWHKRRKADPKRIAAVNGSKQSSN